MAFVDHDEVEEPGRKLAEQLLMLLGPGDGLVEPQVDLVGGVDAALFIKREGDFLGAAVLPLDSPASLTALAMSSVD